MCDSVKIPVTIVTGFLGTGKTTFIKRLCTELQDKKIAILQNEFSKEMGIERPMLLNTGAEVYELPNGCICCSTKDGLVVALESILEVRDKIDWIIVEAAGTADPVDLTGKFWLDYGLESPLVLDGVIAITDVRTIKRILSSKFGEDEPYELEAKQLSVADVIIINKIDLEPLSDGLRSDLTSLYGCNNVIETTHCKVDLKFVLNLNMFNTSKILKFDIKEHTHHDSYLKSLFIKSKTTYSLTTVNDFISNLLWESSNTIYRCKGIFKAVRDCKMIDDTNGSIGIYQLQGVGLIFEITPEDINDIEFNKFLFIGTNFDNDLINQKLESIQAD